MSLLGNLRVKLGLDNAEFKKGIQDSKTQSNKFVDSLKSMATRLAAVFAVDRIIAFGKEMISLRAKVIGVKTAFDALNQPSLLRDLRTATQGTVDDLTLMQRAVQARNFKLPLDQLAIYLEFASKRARETGQSVDYLVDSIITGLGRKSVMILDNLGVSSTELREEMANGGTMAEAFGNIIKRDMGAGNVVLQESIDLTAQIATSWKNMATNLSSSNVGGFFRGIGIMIKQQMDAIGWMSGGKEKSNQGDIYETEAKTAKMWFQNIKSVEDAQRNLDGLRSGALSMSRQIFKQMLEEYVQNDKMAKAEEVRRNNSIVGLKEQATELEGLFREATTDEDRSKYSKEIDKIGARIDALTGVKKEEVIINNSLIEQQNKLIEQKEKEISLSQDRSNLLILNGELKLLKDRLDYLKMTKEQIIALRKESAIPIIESFKSSSGDKFNNVFADRLKANAEATTKANDEMAKEAQKTEDLAKQFESSISGIVANSIEHLTDIIAGTSELNTAQLVAALLSPLADMAIAAGTLIMFTGDAIEALRDGLTSFLGVGAIVAGAALVGVGIAAKAGLKALASNRGSGSTGSTNTYSGGAGGMQVATIDTVIKVEGVIKGNDIYISNQNADINRKR